MLFGKVATMKFSLKNVKTREIEPPRNNDVR